MSIQLFSRPCTYAVRALAFLATQPVGMVVGTREIAEREGIPQAFLGKVLLLLCRERLVKSHRGIGGGYALAVPPEEIRLLAIVRAIDGDPIKNCVLEDRECSARRPCLLHLTWSSLREQWVAYLERTTLAELVRQRPGESELNPNKIPAGRAL